MKKGERFFVRHGAAEEDGEDPGLSNQGRSAVEATAWQMIVREFQIEAVLTSPLRRALETAKILARHFGCEVRVVEDLGAEVPGDKPDVAKQVQALLADYGEGAFVFVGHMPGLLVATEELTGSAPVFAPGAMALVEIHDEGGDLILF